MSLRYLVILVLYALASFGVVLAIGEAAVGLFEKELRNAIERLRPSDGVIAHLLLRVLPGVIALLITLCSALPGYLNAEPAQTNERPGPWLIGLAAMGLCSILIPLIRVCWMAMRTAAKTRTWIFSAVRNESFSQVPVVELGMATPVIVASGCVHKTIFLSSAVRSLLSPRELRAVLRHEVAHCRQNHNLAKLVCTVAPGLLSLNAMSESLCETIEYAADDEASRIPGDALNLASALVILAKQSTGSARELLYTPLITSAESAVLERRVKRLVLPIRGIHHKNFLQMAGACAFILAAILMIGSIPAAQNAFRETLELLVR